MECGAIECGAIECGVMECSAMECGAMECGARERRFGWHAQRKVKAACEIAGAGGNPKLRRVGALQSGRCKPLNLAASCAERPFGWHAQPHPRS